MARKNYKEYKLEWDRKKRLKLIDLLGGICIFCGESDPIVLDFDHIFNDGAEQLRKHRSRNALTFVTRNPERFQLLCKNCNWRKEYWRRRAKHKRKTA